MLKLNMTAGRTTTVTIASLLVLAITAATACSSAAAEPTPVKIESVESALKASGVQFDEPYEWPSTTFYRMHGYEGSTVYEIVDSEEKIWISRFIGPAEAVMAGARVHTDALSASYPGEDGGWQSTNIGAGGYGISAHRTMFIASNLIVYHYGDTLEITSAIEQVMGEPFAGTRIPLRKYDPDLTADYAKNFPKFENIWVDEPAEARDFEVREISGRQESASVRVNLEYSMNMPYSYACLGPAVFDQVVDGDQVRITYRNRIADTDTLGFVSDCVINYRWVDQRLSIPGLLPNTAYTVIFNGEVVATIESLMTVEG